MPTYPEVYPHYMHHPIEPSVVVQDQRDAERLVRHDPLYRVATYTDEEKLDYARTLIPQHPLADLEADVVQALREGDVLQAQIVLEDHVKEHSGTEG